MNEKQNNEQKTVSLPYFGLPRLFPFLKPYGKTFLIMVILGLLSSVIDIILPQFQSYAINHFIAGGTMKGIVLFLALYLLTLAAQIVVNYVSVYDAGVIEAGVGRDLKQRSFDHLQTLQFSYFNQNSVGYVHARVMSDTARIGELVSWGLMNGVWHSTYFIGVVIVMFIMNWKLALLVMIVVPFTAFMIAFFQKRLVVLNRKIRETNSKITANFNEGITGAKTIKTLVVEDKIQSDFEEDSASMKKTSVRATKNSAGLSAIISCAGFFALALVLWRGGIITMQQAMQLGTLSVFISYAQGMMQPVQWLAEEIASLVQMQVNIERLTDLINTKSDVQDTPEVIAKYGDIFEGKRENWESIQGDIEFRDVSFRYPDGEEMVLEHFNLKVPAGTNVAIVGETGAGKTTLVNLVCRFYEPTSGQVLIDGRDVRERSQLWLHSSIGYVLQSPHLFSGTVRDNLRYGNPNATDEQIMAALKLVSADQVIEKMDKGLDSEVGESGDLLSTGEKQLLSFARAILADPRILVLDEATSSIDTMTEQMIQNAIETVIDGRTSFMIAHRLSTVRNADIILVVRDGKIVEQGTHPELMKKRGYYYSLYHQQTQEDSLKAAF
ncbi:MAG: ABC transporter ATP-binding protein [Oscillospiraceae bacterium]|nr:ABC transporter ATP-binding protein [Oscillospiraceae bacterium]